ncbi:MaoC/PaaZ C-terminal domain-containing protein [Streptomyces sp. NPDC046909]|uniref:MaoC/PaaZ C-terminal domain-containing protein n=1 Tax=Streptomyces sp. NPDC046909 TaxID=3155617 RepID=UPI0033D024AF
MELAELSGTHLGRRTVEYGERDVILYALAVGAKADELGLVFERGLRVLPAFALTLGLWTADAVGALGAFTPDAALHGAQSLEVLRELPPTGIVDIGGRVAAVWDKGRSAVVDVVAESAYFTATYSIFLPGRGGWGGSRGDGARNGAPATDRPSWSARFATSPQQAALYRLTGDRHLIHIDPEAARAAGLPGVILHGLCTLGIAARQSAAASGAHPAELRGLRARFAAPVIPGDVLDLHGVPGPPGTVAFTAQVGGTAVLTDGLAVYAER